MGEEQPEWAARIESKLDELLAIYKRFEPFLSRLGGGIFGKALERGTTPRRLGEGPRPPAPG
jgi:hypothetical protein